MEPPRVVSDALDARVAPQAERDVDGGLLPAVPAPPDLGGDDVGQR